MPPPRAGLVVLLLFATGCETFEERTDLTRFVSIDPGRSTVRMAGPRAAFRVVVRNVSPGELRQLHLSVSSAACTARVDPPVLERLIPGQRLTFGVTLERRGTAQGRHPLELTLRAEGLPAAAGMDLVVDLSGAKDEGWIDVGEVQIVNRPQARRAPWLLGLIPLAAVLGWLLWHLSRRQRRKRQGGQGGQTR